MNTSRNNRDDAPQTMDREAKPTPAGSDLEMQTRDPATPSVPFTENLAENVAGALCYLFGWVSGLVFLLVDRRPFVRFHAAQSVAVFATLSIVLLALGGDFLGALVHDGAAGVLIALRRILELVWLIAAVVLMLKAAGGEWYRVAGASKYADRAARGAR